MNHGFPLTYSSVQDPFNRDERDTRDKSKSKKVFLVKPLFKPKDLRFHHKDLYRDEGLQGIGQKLIFLVNLQHL
jgi:hypothetical protein